MSSATFSIRPFVSVGGWYLARGWVLWGVRWAYRKLKITLIVGGSLGVMPLLSYQIGLTAPPTHSLPRIAAPSVVLAAEAPKPAAPPTPPVIRYTNFSYRRAAGNSYAYGNCTYYVANRRFIPGNWGDARTWYSAAQRSGFAVGTAPRVGAIAWTPAGYLGHVALVEEVSADRVYVAEMNYLGWNTVDHRWVSATAFKYIY